VADLGQNGIEAVTLVEDGRTLPAEAYTSEAVLAEEYSRIFGRTWQYAGNVSQLTEPGGFFTSRAGRIPVVVLMDNDGAIRAFANVCPHRGHLVAQGSGCRRTLQCAYHGWTYNLDGSLRNVPRAASDPAFDPSGIALTELRAEMWGPLVFVNPAPDSRPLADVLGGVPELAAARDFDAARFPLRATRRTEIRCNWKVTVDNNTECYHCATIHPSFARDYYVDSDHYLVTAFPETFSHHSPMRRPDEGASEITPDFHLYYVWPNFMLSARRSEYFYTYVYLPLGAGRTAQLNEYYFPAEWSDEQVAAKVDDIETIQHEDWGAFENVQAGLESGMFDRGHLVPSQEELLVQFHRLYASYMTAV